MKVKWNKGLSGLLAAAFLLSGLSFSAAAEKTEAKNILQGCSLIIGERGLARKPVGSEGNHRLESPGRLHSDY